MPVVYCPSCGKPSRQEARFCMGCSARFEDYQLTAEELAAAPRPRSPAEVRAGLALGTPAGSEETTGVVAVPTIPGDNWIDADLAKESFIAYMQSLRDRADPLKTPPPGSRKKKMYRLLRNLVVEDDRARALFLSVRWSSRPIGIPMLASLLKERKLVPEMQSDEEYLEEELNRYVEDSGAAPQQGVWELAGGLKVTRHADPRLGLEYRATNGAAK